MIRHSTFFEGFAHGYPPCAKCGEPMRGWICLPPHEVVFCTACVTWEEANEQLGAAWERGRAAHLS